MTIIATADWHLNNNPRDRYRHDWQKELRGLIRKHKATAVLVLGDLTHEKDWHSGALVNAVVDHLQQLSLLCPVYVLKGNHDYASTTESPFFAFLQHLENVCWIAEPRTDVPPRYHLDKGAIAELGPKLWLPHTRDYKRDWAKLDLKKYDWIFTHNTFAGARDGQELDGIPPDVFLSFANVISGDVHVPQKVGSNITYVGAPYTIRFGDAYSPRVLLIDKDKITPIPCGGPQKVVLELRTKGDSFEVEKQSRTPKAGDIIRMIINLGSGEYAHWSETRTHAHSWAMKREYVVDLIQPLVAPRARMSKRKREAPKSDTELLKSYAHQRKIDAATLDAGLKIVEG